MAHDRPTITAPPSRPSEQQPSPPTGTGPVIGRALQILGAFNADHAHLSLSDLARRARLPVSTVHRMLGELLAWGALERDAQGRYRVGLRLWEVGSLAPRSQGIRELALPHLHDLSSLTRENVQLAVRDGSEVVLVERIGADGAVPTLTRVGGRLAITATGAGLVLLAHAPAMVQDQALTQPIHRHTPFTLTDDGQLRRVLAQIRVGGYAVSDRQLSAATLSVAAPITRADGEVEAAVSVVVRHGTAHVGPLADLVRSAGRAISRAIHTSAF
ncbi:IclR family transcriptional regulator [Streptomyces sp. NPDC050256]|uniref:IclR family transcriptional regulator n=1 Tax=Streptomyces sp. NPDC050256 TaxID=3365607 RepID=UPI00379D6E70